MARGPLLDDKTTEGGSQGNYSLLTADCTPSFANRKSNYSAHVLIMKIFS